MFQALAIPARSPPGTASEGHDGSGPVGEGSRGGCRSQPDTPSLDTKYQDHRSDSLMVWNLRESPFPPEK